MSGVGFGSLWVVWGKRVSLDPAFEALQHHRVRDLAFFIQIWMFFGKFSIEWVKKRSM